MIRRGHTYIGNRVEHLILSGSESKTDEARSNSAFVHYGYFRISLLSLAMGSLALNTTSIGEVKLNTKPGCKVDGLEYLSLPEPHLCC